MNWRTKYPAFAYADAQNGTNDSYDNGSSVLYLPAKDELVNLYNWWNGGAGDENVSARADNNTIITTAEGTEFDIYFYWSATELNTNDAWIVLFNFDITFTTTKTNSNRVRLVRDIVVP